MIGAMTDAAKADAAKTGGALSDDAIRNIPFVELDPPAASEEAIRRLAWLRLLRDGELYPEDPARPLEDVMRGLTAPYDPSRRMLRWLVAEDGGQAVGCVFYEIDVADNPQQVWVDPYVHPAYRRRGLGARMLAQVLANTAPHSPTTFGFEIEQQSAVSRPLGHLVTGRWGLAVRIVDRMSRLELADFDWAGLPAQIAARWDRVGDAYEAHFFRLDELPGPDTGFDVAAYLAAVEEINNRMPLEDFEQKPETFNRQAMADMVNRQRAQGRMLWHFVIVERGSGRTAAYSTVCFNPADPRLVDQWGTGTVAEAQGRGLGKLVKLLMLQKIRRDLPGAMYIDTGNALSNAAMIGINTDLGFREIRRSHAFQVGTERWRELVMGMSGNRG